MSSICVYVYTHTYVHIYVCVFVWLLSHVQLFAPSWIVTHQATLSMGFPRQEYWSGCHASPGDLPDPRIKPMSHALAGGLFTTEPPGKAL